LVTLKGVDIENSVARKTFRFKLPFDCLSLRVVGRYDAEVLVSKAADKMADGLDLIRILCFVLSLIYIERQVCVPSS
jgi:hypothetical protein